MARIWGNVGDELKRRFDVLCAQRSTKPAKLLADMIDREVSEAIARGELTLDGNEPEPINPDQLVALNVLKSLALGEPIDTENLSITATALDIEPHTLIALAEQLGLQKKVMDNYKR